MDNGGVWNMEFDAVDNTPPLLRVLWAPNCSIPYHYHPTGALYFITKLGTMYFDGDVPVNSPLFRRAFNKGDVRWVRPGFSYGPEYNGDGELEITVMGTDTGPQFSDPPSGRYMAQKAMAFVTHVYDST